MPHISVLLNEILSLFRGRKIKIFVDGTLGAGGHAEAILKEHPEIEHFIGIDQDPEAQEIAKNRLSPWKNKIHLVPGNFSDIDEILRSMNFEKVDAVLLDLGVSSMQLDSAERGFSFSKEGPLDMRMNPQQDLTAAEIVNTWSEQELGRIFRDYGEEKSWRIAAKALIEARKKKKFETTLDLAQSLQSVLFRRKNKGINPLTLVFQGLRIAVNQELKKIEEAIPKILSCLDFEGRCAIISFHSLEDRIVKTAFRYAASDKEETTGLGGVFLSKNPTVKLLNRKPIIAEEEEIRLNPRSRSAKLRTIEKLE